MRLTWQRKRRIAVDTNAVHVVVVARRHFGGAGVEILAGGWQIVAQMVALY
jgi:hypothetical protein